MKSAKTYP